MALRVWLPLNGNLENKGLSNCTVTNNGATIDNSGKIGKTYLFDANDDFISIDGADIRNIFKGGDVPFTIAFWIYNIKATGTRAVPFGDYGLTGTIQFNLELNSSAGNWNDDIRFYWNGNPDYRATGTSATPNTWVHLAIVYDGTKVEFYRNGTLVNTRTGTLAALNKTSGAFYLGRDSRTGGTAFGGKLNDVRIYDECLSQKQIKEISKGLVAHYKLEGPGANPNLLLHADKYLKNSPKIKTGTGTDLYDTPGVYYNGLDTSKYYIYSMCCDGTLATAHGGTSTTDATKKYWTAWLYYQDTPYSDSSYSSYQTPVCYHANCSSDSNMYLGNIGNRYYWRVKPPYANCSVRVNAYSNGTDSVSVKFWDFKLEEGTKLTTWLPNQADALYNTFGYDNIFAEDSSGNGHNGVITGSLDYNSDSARYSGCAKFSDNSFIKINQLLNWEAKQVSFSFWFNMTGDTQNEYSAIFIPNGNPTAANGLWLSINTESVGLWAYRGSFKPNYHKAGALIETAGWHHAVFVWDAGISKWYLDGVQYGSTVDTWATETLSSTLDYTIGDSYTGTSWRGTPFTGRLSDFRIYATALSDNDILTMYKNSGIIDNKGNVYAYEFKEE